MKLSFLPCPSSKHMSIQIDKMDKGQKKKGAKPNANNDPLRTAIKYLIFTSIYIKFCGATEEGLF